MAGRSDILAGLAYVELFVKSDKLQAGLKAAQAKLQSFGKSVAITGAFIAGAGAALLAPFTVALHKFIESGSALHWMSQRTGISTNALSELGFAAEQTGTDLGAVEIAVKKMQKALGGMGDEAHAAAATEKALKQLGLTGAKLKGLKPEDQFQKIAESLAEIKDETTQKGIALALFGKSGTMLVPMIKNIKALRAEAKELGLSRNPESAKTAAELEESFNRIRRVIKSTFGALGAAIAPAVLQATQLILPFFVIIQRIVKSNPLILRLVALAGAAMVVVGTFIASVGGGLVLLSSVVGGIAALAPVISAIGSAIGFLFTPVGALVAAIAALAAIIVVEYTAISAAIVYFLRFTKTGQAVTRWFIELGKVVAGFVIVAGVVLYKAVMLSVGALQAIWKVVSYLLTPVYELWKLLLKLGNSILQAVLWPLNRLMLAFSAMGKAVGATFKMVIAAVKVSDFEAAWKIAIAGMEAVWHEFAATVLEGLARISKTMIGLNLITGGVAPDYLDAAAKSERLDAKRKMMEAARLSKESAAKAAGKGGAESGSLTPGVMKAATIGYNARAALMGRQVLGAGRNPVVDALKAGLKLTTKTITLLDSIERHLFVPRVR
jgi:hypothetical protein